MRLVIVGVGQMVDFETGDMRNQLQVQDDSGRVHVIHTDEDTVHELVKVVTGLKYKRDPNLPPMSGGVEDYEHEHEFDVHQQSVASKHQVSDFPVGASVFGDEPETEHETPSISDAEALRDRARANRGTPKIKDLVQSYHDDDSGVAVHDLPADEKGNPMIPGGLPDTITDDIDDEGEAGQI